MQLKHCWVKPSSPNTDFTLRSSDLLARSCLNAFALCKSGEEPWSTAGGDAQFEAELVAQFEPIRIKSSLLASMGHWLSAPKCLVVNGAKKAENFINNCESCGGNCISEDEDCLAGE